MSTEVDHLLRQAPGLLTTQTEVAEVLRASAIKNIHPRSIVLSALKASREPTTYAHTCEHIQMSGHLSALYVGKLSHANTTANVTKAFTRVKRSLCVVEISPKVSTGDVAEDLRGRMHSAGTSGVRLAELASSHYWMRRLSNDKR